MKEVITYSLGDILKLRDQFLKSLSSPHTLCKSATSWTDDFLRWIAEEEDRND